MRIFSEQPPVPAFVQPSLSLYASDQPIWPAFDLAQEIPPITPSYDSPPLPSRVQEPGPIMRFYIVPPTGDVDELQPPGRYKFDFMPIGPNYSDAIPIGPNYSDIIPITPNIH